MGKHEPMSAKAIANKIKAKGLQKIKYYCEMCKKQCRDDNGFKCHIMSESHQRQALIVSENPEKFVSEFSDQFKEGFMFILRARYRTKRVLANTVFQEYIKERDHVHLNGTRWTTLTDFANWLGEKGLVKTEESERGVMVTYIDRDPETLRRQELEAKRAQQSKELAERTQLEIQKQMKATKKIYEALESKKPVAEPVPIEIIQIDTSRPPATTKHEESEIENPVSKSDQVIGDVKDGDKDSKPESPQVIERPVFKVQPMSLKAPTSSSYKPPKRKVIRRSNEQNKRKKDN